MAIGTEESYYSSLLVRYDNTLRDLERFIYPYYNFEEEIYLLADPFFTLVMP